MVGNATHNDEFWMGKALELARKAEKLGEVPVGALLVVNGEMVSKAMNRRETWTTPLGHAELICLQRASQKLKSWRILDATLYVTLEPCVMCSGALVQARVGRVVYGAKDPKGGAVNSLFQIGSDPRLNHKFEVTSGVLENECSEILKNFFKSRRAKPIS